MSRHLLYLHPTDPDWHRPTAELASVLRELGMIDARIDSIPDGFTIGDDFLRQINFLGCSPNIEIADDGSGKSFCHIRIESYDDSRLIHSVNYMKPPRCPACRKPQTDWSSMATDRNWQCMHCDGNAPAQDFDWRQMAGYARSFIAITDVFPNEALPQPAFLEALGDATAASWRYFYFAD